MEQILLKAVSYPMKKLLGTASLALPKANLA